MRNKSVGVLVLTLGLLFGSASAWADQVLRQAEITGANGKVEWLKAGASDWQPVTLNQKLDGGDKLRTGEESSAVLTMDEGSQIDLSAGSEFAVQTLTKDSQTEQLQSVLAIMKGKMKAQVTPLKNGSSFEVETPVMVAAVRGTTFTITVNPDGSVNLTTDDGTVEIIRKGQNKFKVKIGKGKEIRVVVDPATGDVRITSIKGDFYITGPDGAIIHLAEGQTIIIHGGAATFIPLTFQVSQPPAADSFGEPIIDDAGSGSAESLSEPPSGS
ncbi:MAG TPA: FecR family protein [bacterium]|nr:FecR family protein [bacterium]